MSDLKDDLTLEELLNIERLKKEKRSNEHRLNDLERDMLKQEESYEELSELY